MYNIGNSSAYTDYAAASSQTGYQLIEWPDPSYQFPVNRAYYQCLSAAWQGCAISVSLNIAHSLVVLWPMRNEGQQYRLSSEMEGISSLPSSPHSPPPLPSSVMSTIWEEQEEWIDLIGEEGERYRYGTGMRGSTFTRIQDISKWRCTVLNTGEIVSSFHSTASIFHTIASSFRFATKCNVTRQLFYSGNARWWREG